MKFGSGRITLVVGSTFHYVLGPSLCHLLATLCLKAQAYVMFMIYIGPQASPAWPCLCSLVFGLNVWFLARTVTTDPGIVPSRRDRIAAENRGAAPVQAFAEEEEGGAADGTQIRSCPTCEIARPPLSKHCKVCDCCISHMDHHCPYLGICIGRRNYKFFALYVLTGNVGNLLVLLTSAVVASEVWPVGAGLNEGLPVLFAEDPVAGWLCVFCTIMCVGMLPLLIFHTWLISTRQTSTEVWKKWQGQVPYWPGNRRPVEQSASDNWRWFWGPVPASFVLPSQRDVSLLSGRL